MKNLRLRPALILAIIFMAHIAVNHFVISRSFLLRKNADAYQINEALQFSRTITDQNSGGFLKALVEATRTELHPHLYTFSLGTVVSPHRPVNHKDLDLPIQCLNSIFLFILIYSIYGIGNLLFGTREGLLAAILTSFSPVIFGPIRLALIEVPLAALVSLTVFLLLKSNHLSLRRMSVSAGIVFGLAQLTKETAVLFILPCAFFLAFSQARNKQKLLNLLLFLGAAVLVCAPVYLNPANAPIYSGLMKSFITNDPSGILPSSPFLYLEAFPRFYFGWIGFLAAFPLLVSYAVNIRKRHPLLAVWITAALIVHLFCGLKAVRYLIPLVPALFLIISQEAFNPFFDKKSRVYPALLAAIFAIQFCLLNFPPAKLKSWYQPYNEETSGLLRAWREKDISTAEKLVKFIKQDSCPKNKIRIIGLHNSALYERLKYLFTLEGMDAALVSLRPKTSSPAEELRDICSSAGYLFDLAPNPDKTRRVAKRLPADYPKYKAACLRFFELTGEFFMRNGDTIYVYRKKAAEENE